MTPGLPLRNNVKQLVVVAFLAGWLKFVAFY